MGKRELILVSRDRERLGQNMPVTHAHRDADTETKRGKGTQEYRFSNFTNVPRLHCACPHSGTRYTLRSSP